MNKVKQALLDRTPTIGTWMQIGSPDVAEILSQGNWDFIAIDLEHTDIGLPQVADIIRVLEKHDVVPLVRVRENNTMAIRQVLDLGAMGVIVPLVEYEKDALWAVAAAKYPPEGRRGFAFCRTNGWGRRFADYVREANDEIAVIAMIETALGVEHVESILAVDGIDGIFIGPYDLSGSYGIPGDIQAEVVLEACGCILRACKAAGKSVGLHIVEPVLGSVERAEEQGYTFLAVGMDTVFLRHSAAFVV